MTKTLKCSGTGELSTVLGFLSSQDQSSPLRKYAANRLECIRATCPEHVGQAAHANRASRQLAYGELRSISITVVWIGGRSGVEFR